jgi:trans-aconitate 2-methyltransferase
MDEERRRGLSYLWDAEEYSQASGAQLQWARELIAGLSLAGDECVLDLGCGDGKVTAEISALLPRGSITGVDVSPEMIDFARSAFPPDGFPHLELLVMDARELTFEDRFDLIFSNATLHWIVDHRPVLSGIARGLKPGGRVVVSMGGKGNGGEMVMAIATLLKQAEWNRYFGGFANPYGFYGPEEYAGWLEEAGLIPLRVELVYKDMTQPGRDGLAAWIRTTWLPFTQRIPEERRESFISQLVDTYLEKHPLDPEGLAHVEMFRLEVEAFKPSPVHQP